MTVNAQNPLSYVGVAAKNPPNVTLATSNPTTSTVGTIGDFIINTSTGASYQLMTVSGSTYTWTTVGGASSDVNTINTLPPTGGNITIAGTASQVSIANAGSTVTLSLPAAITAPGSLTTTTSLTATTTVTAGTGITSTTGNIVATAGAVNAGTSMTATAGDITATLGHVVINGAAKQLKVHGGAVTDFIGQATLTNGTVTVANTNIAATDRVFVTRSAKNGSTAYGTPLITITAATNFVITACKADTTTETNDASTFDYFIVRQV